MGAQPAACTLTMRGRRASIQPSFFHFVKRLPHADQPRPSTGGIQNDVRQGPVALFRQLIAHRFLAFETVGLLQGRDVEPALSFFAFGDELAAIGNKTVNKSDVGARLLALKPIGQWNIFGHKDMGFEPGLRRIGRQRAGRIPGRGNGQLCHSEFFGH